MMTPPEQKLRIRNSDETSTIIRLGLALLLLLLSPLPSRAQVIEGGRVFVEFSSDPTTPELTAVKRAAPKAFAKAQAAGRPVTVSVARSEGTTLISLESVAICERAKGCPLLVFRDLSQRPVLETTSFQNVILDYRDKATYLIIRLWGATTECRISGVAKAKCKSR